MRKKRLISRIAVVMMSILLVHGIQRDEYVLNANASESLTDFTDAASRGGWQKTQGNGTIEFVDGEGENGYMEVHSDNNTIYADTEAEDRLDGYVEMDMTMSHAPNGARMVIVFRYNSPTDWEGVGVDQGNWLWFSGAGGWGDLEYSEKTFTEEGESHRVRVEYRGTNVRIIVDDTKVVVDQEVSSFGNSGAGKIGMRLWGIISENYDNAFRIDNVRYGDVSAPVAISPKEIKIPYAEAGTKDQKVSLSAAEPAFSGLWNGETELKAGTDYSISEQTVTIKKEYIAKCKEKGSQTLTFAFEDGQKQNLQLVIEKEEGNVSYFRNFEDGMAGIEKVSGNGTMNVNDSMLKMQGNGLFIDQNSYALKNQEVEFVFDPQSNNCNYGVVLRYVSPSEYIYVGPAAQVGQHYTNWGIYGPTGQKITIQDSGFILQGRMVPYKVKVRIIDDVITIFVDNEEIYNGEVSGLTDKAGKTGFRTTQNSGMNVWNFVQTTAEVPSIVEAPSESVTIASEMMSVKMDRAFPRVIEYTLATGEKVKGQELPVHQLEINNQLYTPKVTSEVDDSKITYHVSEEETEISFDVVFTVEENVLLMEIQNVEEPQEKLYTLNFPGHSLVSMSSKDAGGRLTVNNFQKESRMNLSTVKASDAYGETSLAVLSNNNVAAAISGDSYKNRHEIAYRTFQAEEHTSTGLWMNEYTYRGLDGELIDYIAEDGSTEHTPWTKVAVTTDRNDDGKVDYQDGAIALRDDCMKRKIGGDEATSSWNMIAMNVGSQAQYPFLRILDNVKKMSLATDNFKQNIYIKGYQSEGHDAAHPDFANYNQRAGGLKDFKVLLENSEDYNATIGIHINHTEVYPEAPQYDKLKTNLAGWSWYDSSMQIVRENDGLDKSEDGLDGRLAKLYDKDTESQIDTTYVDVFFGTRWPMYKLVQNIIGMDRGIGLGTEYTDEFVYYSTFAHHIVSDFGGAGNLVRFVNHDQADIFVNHPLFRGASSRNTDEAGINGWQSAKNMNNALQAFYEKILPNKFLAQYPVMRYETDTKAVLGQNNEVVTEMKDGVNVITKNGAEVANGNKVFIPWEANGVQEGKIYHWNREGGVSTWTLPESWDDVSNVIMYELSDQGKGQAVGLKVNDGNVTIRAKAQTGYVIYKAKVKNYDTADKMEWSTAAFVKDMGFDSHNFDEWTPTSTAANTDHITIENNALGNTHLYIRGENDGKVSQTITGLTRGKTYAASVWCTVSSGRKGSIEIKNGKEIVSNYMTESNVINSICHCDKYQTPAQRMEVRFVAKGDSVVLSLTAEKGASANAYVDFDDVRLVEVKPDTNPKPKEYVYWEDFETVDQGFGLFVSTVDYANNSLSDRSHLAQLNPVNPEYTTDVIDGEFSLKVRASDYVRTIPATMRLESNKEYTIGMEYKATANNAITVAVKSDKAQLAGDKNQMVIASVTPTDASGEIKLTFTTGNYDDYYLDVTKLNTSCEYSLDNVYVEGEVVEVEVDEVVRLFGDSRYDTGYAVANELKTVLGGEKFEAVVVATGKNFADALAGSYLAVEKNAPILLTNGKDDNVAQLHAYIKANVVAGGTVYILGGEGAVPAAVEGIEGYEVVRLFGVSRYDTNMAILAEAGVSGDSIIVATGKTFADSLSASAVKLPILLVKPNATLNAEQTAILTGIKNIYIVGGEGAVSAAYEKELEAFGKVTRVFGESRYDTSVEIAKTFCKDAEKAVVVSGKNFPDGLCGGSLAAALNAPLVLTKDGGAEAAVGYVAGNGVASGYVLGGTGALADETVVEVFDLESAEEIID